MPGLHLQATRDMHVRLLEATRPESGVPLAPLAGPHCAGWQGWKGGGNMNTPPQGSVDAMSALHAALVKELPHHCPAGWWRHSAKSRAGEAQLPASMQHWRQQPQSSEFLHLSCAPLTSHTLCRRARSLVGAHLESQPLGSPGSGDAGGWHLHCFPQHFCHDNQCWVLPHALLGAAGTQSLATQARSWVAVDANAECCS